MKVRCSFVQEILCGCTKKKALSRDAFIAPRNHEHKIIQFFARSSLKPKKHEYKEKEQI